MIDLNKYITVVYITSNTNNSLIYLTLIVGIEVAKILYSQLATRVRLYRL